MTTPDRKLETVRRLLAKADGASTAEEAEAYTAKALEMMARHGIDEALLAADGDAPDDAIGDTRLAVSNPYSAGKARLLAHVANPLRCQVVFYGSHGSVTSVALFGYASDRARAELLYTSLLLQATTQLTRVRPSYAETNYFDPPPAVVAAYRRSWLHGFARRVGGRIQQAEDAAAASADAQHRTTAGGVSTALVLVDRNARVERAYADAFPNLKTARRPTFSGTGYQAGAKAGERADLGGGNRVATSGRRALPS